MVIDSQELFIGVSAEAESSQALGGGCNIGEPLLVAKAGGGLEMSTCYTNKNCHQGFYCSTALMDVASRCCRSDQGQLLLSRDDWSSPHTDVHVCKLHTDE